MNQSERKIPVLELAAPSGWTALLLEQRLPAVDEQLLVYQDAVEALLAELPYAGTVVPEEVLLLFERCRPEFEAVTVRENARAWMPEFGVGIWIDQPPPTKWTQEEFQRSAPGTLRPVVERVLRVRPDVTPQRAAWKRLLGSGTLLRLRGAGAGTTLSGTSKLLRPTIRDISLTSFPFYVPLLRGSTLMTPAPTYAATWDQMLPGIDLYLRESAEDGGLLILHRQSSRGGSLLAGPGPRLP